MKQSAHPTLSAGEQKGFKMKLLPAFLWLYIFGVKPRLKTHRFWSGFGQWLINRLFCLGVSYLRGFRLNLHRSFRGALICRLISLRRLIPPLRPTAAAPASPAAAAFLLVAGFPSGRALRLLAFTSRHWLGFFRVGCGGRRSRFMHGGS